VQFPVGQLKGKFNAEALKAPALIAACEPAPSDPSPAPLCRDSASAYVVVLAMVASSLELGSVQVS